MTQIHSEQITSQLKALFRPDDPAGLRCFAVLEGDAAGSVWADDPVHPTWGLVRESGFGSIYLGGQPDARALAPLITELKEKGDVLVGLPHGDPRWELFSPSPDLLGLVLEFTERADPEGNDVRLNPLSEGHHLQRVDRELFARCLERDLMVSIFGTADRALAHSFGFCLMRGEQILSEAHAGPRALGAIEIGTMTGERYRYRGFAAQVCAHLIRVCEELGWSTYWNCNKHNRASVALAHKLGYRGATEYELRGWMVPG